ncbi:MAG: hypothetical protein ABI875_07615 [Gemmatimonadales bacterium]
MRALTIAVAALGLITGALRAQGADPDKLVADGGVKVPGWMGRIDPQAAKGGRKITDDKVVAMGPGFHVISGPAAVYWNPANTASGNYKVSGTFSQGKAAAHPEAYGLIIGGKDLDTPNQSYLYFLVRQDGKYLINHRANDSTVHKIVDWTANSAVKSMDGEGKATNALSIAVGPDKLTFLVNGTEVATLPRSEVDRGGPGSGTTGLAGIRVNHNLSVHVSDFGVRK